MWRNLFRQGRISLPVLARFFIVAGVRTLGRRHLGAAGPPHVSRPSSPAYPMRSISALVLLVLVASPLAAQRAPSGAIEGQITDSVRVAPLAGALVTATHVAAGRESTFVATSDAQGRFRFDSLAVGEYALRFASPMLDSLQYGGPTTQARVTAGGVTRAALAVPSGATIRGMAGPRGGFSAGRGAPPGLLSHAARGKPPPGAPGARGGGG